MVAGNQRKDAEKAAVAGDAAHGAGGRQRTVAHLRVTSKAVAAAAAVETEGLGWRWRTPCAATGVVRMVEHQRATTLVGTDDAWALAGRSAAVAVGQIAVPAEVVGPPIRRSVVSCASHPAYYEEEEWARHRAARGALDAATPSA